MAHVAYLVTMVVVAIIVIAIVIVANTGGSGT